LVKRRSVVQVSAGAILGSALTALVFVLCSEPRPMPVEEMDDAETSDGRTQRTTVARPGSKTPNRDLTGDCVLSGSVTEEDGKPAPRVLVRVRLLDEPWVSADLDLETETDDKGLFAFEGLTRNAKYQIWAWSHGNAVTDYEDAQCGAKTHLMLEKGATLSVKFIDPRGKPAGAVEVMLAGSSLWPTRRTMTNDLGELTIEGLAPGLIMIHGRTHDARLAYTSQEPLEVQAGKEIEITLSLQSATPAKVIVTDKTNRQPISGAAVLLGPDTASLLHRVFLTGEDGTAILPGLITDDNVAWIIASGYVRSPPKPIAPGAEVSFVLNEGGVIEGVVQTNDGTPVMGASILVDMEMGGALTAMPGGSSRRFSSDLLNAATEGWPAMTAAPDDSVTLAGPANLPFPAISSEKDSALGMGRWRPTDKQGRFELNGLPAGRMVLNVEHEEFVTGGETTVTMESGARISDVMITVKRGVGAKVRVLNEAGYPIRNALVTVYNRDEDDIASLPTGTDGFAEFGGLPASFRIEASADDMIPATARIKGRLGHKMEVNITLPPADKSIHGRVIDEDGHGVADVSITAKSITRGLVQAIQCNTGTDGSFTLEKVGKGSYHLVAEKDGKILAQVGNVAGDNNITLVAGAHTGNQAQPDINIPDIPSETLEDPFESPDSENMGMIAITNIEDNLGSVNSEYGQADRLVVTGPPSGKGGLPITVRGSPGKVFVGSVQPGTLAAGAGLAAGDRIIAVDNVKITSPAQARRAIAGRIGSVVVIGVVHKNEHLSIVIQRVRVP
jgi:hypothetical protein